MSKSSLVFPEIQVNVATEEDACNCYSEHSSDFKTYFMDPAIQVQYEHYRIQSTTSWSTMVVGLLVVASVLVDSGVGLFIVETKYSNSSLYVVRMVLMTRIVLCCIAMLVWYQTLQFRKENGKGVVKTKKQSYGISITRLTNVLVIGLPLMNGLLLCWQVTGGSCQKGEDGNYLHSDEHFFFDCNVAHTSGGLPSSATLMLLLSNLFLVTTLRSFSYWALKISFVITLSATVIATLLSPKPTQSLIVLVGAALTVIMGRSQEEFTYTTFRSLLQGETAKRLLTKDLQVLISNVGHDVKTPLHGLTLGISSLVEDCRTLLPEGGAKNNLMQSLEECQVNCSFMQVAMNRTVDYTKSIANIALQPKQERVSLQDSIQWAVKCMGDTTPNRIAVNILPSLTGLQDSIVTDKQWLHENILCYVSNAVKYTVAGGTVTLQASLLQEGDPQNKGKIATGGSVLTARRLEPPQKTIGTQFLRISVEDEGVGMASELLQGDLFESCPQMLRLGGGAGLGLHCLKQRVQTLGGEAGRDNKADGSVGSVFWFTVPINSQIDNIMTGERMAMRLATRSNSNTSVSRTRRSRYNAGNSDSGSNSDMETSFSLRVGRLPNDLIKSGYDGSDDEEECLTALVVDDSTVVVKATRRMLQQAGYTVATAENGAIGLEKMKAKLYDVVLMDIEMPVMGGLEATRLLRAYESECQQVAATNWEDGFDVETGGAGTGTGPRDRKRKQFIIGVSANGGSDARGEALQSGMCDFSPKPFSYHDLCKMQARQSMMNDSDRIMR